MDIMKCRGAQWCIHSYRVLNLRSIGPMQAVLEWLMACVDPERGQGGTGVLDSPWKITSGNRFP